MQIDKKLAILLPIALAAYLLTWVIPLNVSGDGLAHLNTGRGIAESGATVPLQPGTTEWVPYPQTYHMMLSLVYMWMGEAAVKYFPPLCGVILSLAVYVLLRRLNPFMALATGLFSVLLLTHMFVSPLLEPYMLLSSVLAIYSLHRFLKLGDNRYGWLFAVFVGLSMCVKHPGLILFGALAALCVAIVVYLYVSARRSIPAGSAAALFLVPVVLSFPALRDQFERMGYLFPNIVRFSYVHWDGFEAISRIVKEYMLGPLFWQLPDGWVSLLFIPVSVVFLGGIYHLFRKDRLLLLILVTALAAEILTTYVAGTLVRHYHAIGIIAALIILTSGILFFLRMSKSMLLAGAVVAVLMGLGMTGVYLYNKDAWRDSGRCNDEYVSMYKQVGEFIWQNIGTDERFLAVDREGFAYYSLSKGGTQVRSDIAFATPDEHRALAQLAYYGASHVFIETRLYDNIGASWRYPPDGLISYIDASPHFREVYSVQASNGDSFILYEVIQTDAETIRSNVMADIDELCEYYLSNQVHDKLAINHGSFTGVPAYSVHDPYFERYNEGPLSILAYAWNSPESRYYRDPIALEAVKSSLLALCRVQTWTGGFPVGLEVEDNGHFVPVGVELQDYGDIPHQYFLISTALYAYNIIADNLDVAEQQKIELMLKRAFEFCVIEPVQYSSRSLTYKGEAPTHDTYYRETVTVPREALESAARLDIVLRVEQRGDPDPAIWKASIGDIVLELDTSRVNPKPINPYREYAGWEPISVAVWQVDDVQSLIPFGSQEGDYYTFDIVFHPVPEWMQGHGLRIVRSESDTIPSFISEDGVTWEAWGEDLALQVWLYESNVNLVNARAGTANQEAGRLYVSHQARWLFERTGNVLLRELAQQAFDEGVQLFAGAPDGVFPEANHVILQAMGSPETVGYGGWSPGHGMISNYLLALIAAEDPDSGLLEALYGAACTIENLTYRDGDGYKLMSSPSARDKDGVLLTEGSKNLFALGFASLTNSSALHGVVSQYTPQSPVDYANSPYHLFANQIDSMPLIAIHQYLPDKIKLGRLPNLEKQPRVHILPDTKILIVNDGRILYFISYGNATPSGGSIATAFDLVHRKYIVSSTGAKLDYGNPLHEIRDDDGSSSAWDTESEIVISNRSFPFQVTFSGFLRFPDQTPTRPYTISYEFTARGLRAVTHVGPDP